MVGVPMSEKAQRHGHSKNAEAERQSRMSNNLNMDQYGRTWKWAIEPNPYNNDYDVCVTDSDEEARVAILHAAEMILFDDNDGGEVRTLKVSHVPEVKKDSGQ